MSTEKPNPFSKKLILAAILVSLSNLLLPSSAVKAGQIAIQAWVARYDGPADFDDTPYDMAVDVMGNVFVTGTSYWTTQGWWGTTIRYDSLGNQQWVVRTTAPYFGWNSLALDASDNVYVTGSGNGDFYTVECDANGNLLWADNTDFGGNDEAMDIVVDAHGNSYVTGRSITGATQASYATAKYDSTGKQAWSALCHGPASALDEALAVAVDSLGDVYVTGFSTGIGSDTAASTVKYDPNGNQLWVARYDGPEHGSDGAKAMALDASGNSYIAGYSGSSTLTAKYDANGNLLWAQRHSGGSLRGIALDDIGNVYVTGDYTIKYDNGGKELWADLYGQGQNQVAESLALDASRNVYVTGAGWYNPYATVKYDTNGKELWRSTYGTPSNSGWIGPMRDVAIDGAGNVYASCDSLGTNGQPDYVIIKYTQDNSPNMPANISPADGAIGTSLTPTLQSSAFSDPDAGDSQGAAQWQVTTSSDNYDSPAYESGIDNSDWIQVALPSGALAYGTTYYWRVRHQDNHGAWSNWSAETSFTIANRCPNQPTNLEPPSAAANVSLTPTLQSSPFSDPYSGDIHVASQWQVRETSNSYSSSVFDSGTDNIDLTIMTVPSGLLSHSTAYCWHVRYQDNRGQWSDWSAETFFTTTGKGGLPFWIWIIVGVAAVLLVGMGAYMIGRRKPAKPQQ